MRAYLRAFAEQGPEFVGGRVQSIRNNLKQVHADPEKNASVFQLVAKECSNLLQMLNTTRMRVREANERSPVPRILPREGLAVPACPS